MVLVKEIAWGSSVWIENEPNNIVHFERIGVKMKYNPETVKTVLNVIQREFEAENGRNEHIESKVRMMLTIASILLTAIIFIIKMIIEKGWFINLNTALLLLAILTTTGAIYLFLYVIMIKPFERIKYEALINNELESETVNVESRLIATYEEALINNKEINDNKAKTFRIGTKLIMISIGMIFILLIFLCININTLSGGNL